MREQDVPLCGESGECAGARDVPGEGKGDEAKEGKGELEGKRESVTKEEVGKKKNLKFFFLSLFLSFFLCVERETDA